MKSRSIVQWWKQVLFNEDFAREIFASTGIRTRNLLTRIFFNAASTFRMCFLASSCMPDTDEPLLVAITLEDLVMPAIATVSVASNQTQSLYIQ